jgi:hypothetical protein
VDEYRATQYNPAFRSPAGKYMADGSTNAHLWSAASAFLAAAGLHSLGIEGLQNSLQQGIGITVGDVLSRKKVVGFIGRMRQENSSCNQPG